MTTSEALVVRARRALGAPPQGIYLNTSAEGLPLSVAAGGYQRYLSAKSQGSRGRTILDDIEHEARHRLSRVFGVPERNLGFVTSTSRALDAVIKSIPWQVGDTVVLPAVEFPTAGFAAELLAKQGVKICWVQPTADGTVLESDIIDALDERTRLVILSLVSFYSGQHIATRGVIERAHELGAFVFLDCVQALGNVVVDVGEADFAAAATFKWLQGVHGVAGLYVSDRALDALPSPYVAYRSVSNLFGGPFEEYLLHGDARRYEEGMPDYGALAVLSATLDVSENWRSEIADHNSRLGKRLVSGLTGIGFSVLAADARRTSIVSFVTPHFAAIRDALAEAGVSAWARDGRVRFSGHVYTSPGDVDDALSVLGRMGGL